MTRAIIHALFAESALLPEGWARDVLFEIGPDGVLRSVTPGTPAERARVAALAWGGMTPPEIARARIAAEPDKYVHHIYGEHEVGGTGWLYGYNLPAGSDERMRAEARRRLQALLADEPQTWCDTEELVVIGRAHREVLAIAAGSTDGSHRDGCTRTR